MNILHLVFTSEPVSSPEYLPGHIVWLAGAQANLGHDVTLAAPGTNDVSSSLAYQEISGFDGAHLYTGAVRDTRAQLQIFVSKNRSAVKLSPCSLFSLALSLSSVQMRAYDVIHIHHPAFLECQSNSDIPVAATDWGDEAWPDTALRYVNVLVRPHVHESPYIPWTFDLHNADPATDLNLPHRYGRDSITEKRHNRDALRKAAGFGTADDPPLITVLGTDYADKLAKVAGFQFLFTEGLPDALNPISECAEVPTDVPRSLLLAGSDAILLLNPSKPPLTEVSTAALYGTPTLMISERHYNLVVDYDPVSFSGTGFHTTPGPDAPRHLLQRFLTVYRNHDAMKRLRQHDMDLKNMVHTAVKAYLSLYKELT